MGKATPTTASSERPVLFYKWSHTHTPHHQQGQGRAGTTLSSCPPVSSCLPCALPVRSRSCLSPFFFFFCAFFSRCSTLYSSPSCLVYTWRRVPELLLCHAMPPHMFVGTEAWDRDRHNSCLPPHTCHAHHFSCPPR